MPFPTPTLGGIAYFPLEGYSGYSYTDELAVVRLLGRDGALADRNEVLQQSAKGAMVATVEALCETAAARDALLALFATQTTHDDASGEAVRNVTVVKAENRLMMWSGAPIWVVTLTLRTR